jgi:hypothetical protein
MPEKNYLQYVFSICYINRYCNSVGFKVPKCEIFDRSDFPDFYTIKSSWVGYLVVNSVYLLIILIFEGAKPHLVSDA